MKKTGKISAALLSAAVSLSLSGAVFTVSAANSSYPFPPLEKSSIRYYTNPDESETVIMYNDGSTAWKYDMKENGWGTCCSDYDNLLYYVTAKAEDLSEIPEDTYVISHAPVSSEPDVMTICNKDGNNMSADKAKELVLELNDKYGVSDVDVYSYTDLSRCYFYGSSYTVLGRYTYSEDDFSGLIEKGYTITEDEYGLTIAPPGYDELSEGEKIPASYKTMLDVMKVKLPEGAGLMPCIPSEGMVGYKKVDIFSECPAMTDMVEVYESKFGEKEIQTVKGDLNGNGVTDLYDAIIIAESFIEARVLSDAEMETADFNSDGKVDIYDVIGIAETLI